MCFFPRVTDELVGKLGVDSSDYLFSYYLEDHPVELSFIRKRGLFAVEDPSEVWKISEDGLRVQKSVSIDHPEKLFGKKGVAPAESYLAICILWTNRRLSQTGVIHAARADYDRGVHLDFDHMFEPGTLCGDLSLDLVVYLKEPAVVVSSDELHLMNEAGAILGSLEEQTDITFDNNCMEFPIGEVHRPGEPLWWMSFSSWTDPREDSFSEENIQLILNTAHKDCPEIKNGKTTRQDVLLEVLAGAFFSIFEKVREMDDAEIWSNMKDDTGLQPGSICGVLHQFSRMDPEHEFLWSSIEGRMLSIKRIVAQSMAGDVDA